MPQQHNYTMRNVIEEARRRGSTAATKKGAIRWLLNNPLPKPSIIPIPGIGWEWIEIRDGWRGEGRTIRREHVIPGTKSYVNVKQASQAAYFHGGKPMDRAAYRKRKTDGMDREALRARDDTKFRRRWVAGLKRQYEALANVPTATLMEVSKAATSHPERRRKVKDIARRCVIAGIKWMPQDPEQVAVGKLVPVSEDWARAAKAPLNMRGHYANIFPTNRFSYGYHTEGSTEWKNGKPVGYTHATHDNYVRSFALINGPVCEYALHEWEFKFTCPDGYSWRVDSLGLCLVASDGVEYHPGLHELRSKDPISHMVASIAVSRRQRQEQLAANLKDLPAGAESCRVTLEDSRRAGNCVEGTLRWCSAKLGMDRESILRGGHLIHVPASRLIATGESRALAAVRKAWERETAIAI